MKKNYLIFLTCIFICKRTNATMGKAFGSASDDRASSIAVDENNNVVVAVFFLIQFILIHFKAIKTGFQKEILMYL